MKLRHAVRRLSRYVGGVKIWAFLAIVIIAVEVVLTAVIFVAAHAPQPVVAAAAPTLPRSESVDHPARPVYTLAVVGDSISEYGEPEVSTWTELLVGDVVLSLDDGYAKKGTGLAEQATHITAIHSDVLVVMSGTNDLGPWGTPVGDRLASLDLIVAQAQAPRVLIAAVAPLSAGPWEVEWNAQLAEFAAARGWDFVDPWASIRNGDDWLNPADTFDTVHPNASASVVVAAAITAKVEEMLR